ncbi:OprO/OprP family phosphate-selective porin [Nitrosococcus watsonii]|uniref:Phosphate-selective porin O and P n=1 Tax=Nitrosococcus watsoni (strain C-113) TaxID=105559 RepID=D8KBR7_NITWC|nr:porin [Nitrosococcus watsonii]ADJ27678.1 phosphate-selective porin O and P [Nitrosococcus watsonii C-113]
MKFQTKDCLLYGVILICCINLFIAPAHGGTKAMLELLKILRDRGTLSQDEFEMLRNAAKAEEEEASEPRQPHNGNPEVAEQKKKPTEEVAKVHPNSLEQDSIKVKTNYKGLTVETADGDFKFGIGGRLQMDANFAGEGRTPRRSGTEIRRARINVQGSMWKIWGYRLQADFAGNYTTAIKNAYIEYTGFKPVSFILGQQKLPFTLQSWTSNNWQVFQERALLNSFIQNEVIGRRGLGFRASTYGRYWTANAGIFSESVGRMSRFRESWAPMGRVTFAPIAEATQVLHFGASAYYRNYVQEPELVFTAHPEAHLVPPLISTGVISGTEDILLLGGELSGVWGPFHAQGEYLHVKVGRKKGLPDPDFNGWYAQAGYFLTGESRSYDPTKGRYNRIHPSGIVGKGGWGAWELAFRYSTLDLTDNGILGGVENNFTVGLNWYATPSILFRANYIHAGTDFIDKATRLEGIEGGLDIYTLRGQIAF